MKLKLLIILVLAGLVVSCNAPVAQAPTGGESGGGGVRAWFDGPLPGTVYISPNPICQIVAHGASPNGIALFELSVNGAVSASIPSPDANSSLVTLTRDCGLTEPGRYDLQVRVKDNAGQWSGFAQTSLIIAEAGTVTPTGIVEVPTAITTPTLVPATGGVSVERVSTDTVYLGESSCGPLQVSVLARATAPKGIQVVVLFYRFQNGPKGFESVAMNPQGGDLFQGTVNPTSALGGVPFEQSTLQYQVVVQQRDGDTSIRTPVIADVLVKACGSVTTETSCSSYTDQRSCIAHGCNWVAGTGMFATYTCKQP